jgi:hypothetical protein
MNLVGKLAKEIRIEIFRRSVFVFVCLPFVIAQKVELSPDRTMSNCINCGGLGDRDVGRKMGGDRDRTGVCIVVLV